MLKFKVASVGHQAKLVVLQSAALVRGLVELLQGWDPLVQLARL